VQLEFFINKSVRFFYRFRSYQKDTFTFTHNMVYLCIKIWRKSFTIMFKMLYYQRPILP